MCVPLVGRTRILVCVDCGENFIRQSVERVPKGQHVRHPLVVVIIHKLCRRPLRNLVSEAKWDMELLFMYFLHKGD